MYLHPSNEGYVKAAMGHARQQLPPLAPLRHTSSQPHIADASSTLAMQQSSCCLDILSILLLCQ